MASDSTPVRGRPYPAESDTPDVAADMAALALSLDHTPNVGVGTLSNRPNPSAPGNRYLVYGDSTAANNGIEWIDTGSAWIMSAPHIQPVGSITQWGGSGDPQDADGVTRWLVCDGRAILRATYPVYMSNIGTEWGAGDGQTTVNLPDFRGRSLFGAGQGSGLSNRGLSQEGGEESVTLSESQLPPHDHDFGGASLLVFGSTPYGFANGGNQIGVATQTGGVLGGAQNAPVDNMPPFAVVNHIIKVQ